MNFIQQIVLYLVVVVMVVLIFIQIWKLIKDSFKKVKGGKKKMARYDDADEVPGMEEEDYEDEPKRKRKVKGKEKVVLVPRVVSVSEMFNEIDKKLNYLISNI